MTHRCHNVKGILVKPALKLWHGVIISICRKRWIVVITNPRLNSDAG